MVDREVVGRWKAWPLVRIRYGCQMLCKFELDESLPLAPRFSEVYLQKKTEPLQRFLHLTCEKLLKQFEDLTRHVTPR